MEDHSPCYTHWAGQAHQAHRESNRPFLPLREVDIRDDPPRQVRQSRISADLNESVSDVDPEKSVHGNTFFRDTLHTGRGSAYVEPGHDGYGSMENTDDAQNKPEENSGTPTT